ncbi:hypothetical protein [Actinotignum urinale]|uniref:hypothetical protein n=1 Tax=Actinotignum urinale TaxID=190146 RepID=UPI00370D4AEA
MMAPQFRRPAQLSEDLMETIPGDQDVAYNAELANLSAWALLPGPSPFAGSPQERERIVELVHTEGVDVIAESWVRSPEESLAGTLWRGFLFYEWLRRFPEDAFARFNRAREVLVARGVNVDEKLADTYSLEDLHTCWGSIFSGEWGEHPVAKVLLDSAHILNIIGQVSPEWIGEDDHPLATAVTRRDEALLQTSRELLEASKRSGRGVLN